LKQQKLKGYANPYFYNGQWTVPRHDVRQMTIASAYGPEFIMKCPIRPGVSYTYMFTSGEEDGGMHTGHGLEPLFTVLLLFTQKKDIPTHFLSQSVKHSLLLVNGGMQAHKYYMRSPKNMSSSICF
ncbi:hypothetical protein Tco_1277772, partial [Tanacetum coccineum]